MFSISVCCTWSRRPAVWCAPVWKRAAPPRLLCPRCCWSAAPADAPETRCTAHKGSGGSTFPPPEQRQRTLHVWSKTKPSIPLIKTALAHTSTKKLWSCSRKQLYVSRRLRSFFHNRFLCSVSWGRNLTNNLKHMTRSVKITFVRSGLRSKNNM